MLGSDYASTIRSYKPSRFNFKWPFKRSDRELAQPSQQFSAPPFGGPIYRSNSSIMDEAMRGAYGTDANSLYSAQAYLDDKKHGPNYPPSIAEPAPVKQASIRTSIANWFRRSPGNHPLKLNPMGMFGGRSTPTTARSVAGVGSQYAGSVYSASQASAIPSIPEMTLQRNYMTGATGGMSVAGSRMSMSTGTPSNPAELASVSTLDEGPEVARFWSASTVGLENVPGAGAGATTIPDLRMSGSSWSSEKQSTIMPSERDTKLTGLSPPSYYFGSEAGGGASAGRGGASSGMLGTESLNVGGGLTAKPEEGGRLTNLHDELFALYAQGEKEAAMEDKNQGKSGSGAPRL